MTIQAPALDESSLGSSKEPNGEHPASELRIKKRILTQRFLLPDPAKASFGARLRYLRRRLGLTIEEFSKETGLAHGAISRIERDAHRVLEPWLLGRIVPVLQARASEAFPGDRGGDPYDFLYPKDSFGGWLKNFRARRGLLQKDVAEAVGVSAETIRRYEAGICRPYPWNVAKLRAAFNLDDELRRYLK